MTDKVQKIREEVARLYNQSLADENRQVDRDLECAANVSYGKSKACKELLSFIDSLQEEPAPKIFEDMLNAKTPAESLGISAEEHDKIIDLCLYGKEPEMVDIDDLPKEEPVSEDLKEIAWNHADKKCYLDIAVFTPDEVKKERGKMQFTWQDLYDAVMFGAEWQKEQMMAKAVDGDITFDYYGDDDKTYGCIAHDSFCLEDFGLKDRDKVKVIIIKEIEL